MVRLRLTDATLAAELATFLRRCECDVDQLGPTTLGVAVRHKIAEEAALRQLRAGRCYRCGDEIESMLFRLGSPLCLDCRQGLKDVGATSVDGPAREEWTRMEVAAYLRVWQALHPDGGVELVA